MLLPSYQPMEPEIIDQYPCPFLTNSDTTTTHLNLMLERHIAKALGKYLVDSLIEGRNNFLRVLDQLAVQLRTELLDVSAGDVQIGILGYSELKRWE